MLKSGIYGLLLCLLALIIPVTVVAQPGECDPEAALRVIANAVDTFYITTMSGNGRYVAYASHSDAIVPDDTNEAHDIFVYDRLDCSTRRVSVNSEGEEGNGSSYPSKFSEDGRYLLLYSNATNFHPDYPGEIYTTGMFILDLETHTYHYIGLNVGLPGDMSADGRFVVFGSIERFDPTDLNDVDDLYVYDRVMDTYQRITPDFNFNEGPYSSNQYFPDFPGISADGSYTAFSTDRSLVAEDTNEYFDIYLYERSTGNLELISTTPQGLVADYGSMDWPTLSSDGRYIAFQSWAGNLSANQTHGYYETNDVFLYDRNSGEIVCISLNEAGECGDNGNAPNFKTSVSADARYILYHWIYDYDTEEAAFLIYDRVLDETHRISVTETGQPIDVYTDQWITKTQHLSNDGRWAIFFGAGGLYLTDWQQLLQLPGSEPDAAPVRNHFAETAPLLTWNEITWAAGYEIQIDDNANFSSPDYSTTVAADVLEITLLEDDLAQGVYHWRVRAQRSNGTWGAWSSADEFAYRIYEWD